MSDEFTWLNTEFLSKIVQNQFGWEVNDFAVENFDVTRASAKGDNYLGTLLRVRVSITHKTEKLEKFYIVKTSAGDGNISEDISSQFGAYPKEKEMYMKILPAFEEIYKEVGIDVTFGPKCYGVFEDPTDIIILEDLKESDFKIGNRCIGLSLNHALLAIEKVAQFHAASLIYLEKHGKFDQKFDDGFFCTKLYTDEWKPYYQAMYESFVNIISTWPDFEKIIEKAKQWKGHLYLHGVKAVELQKGDFGCLVHGDMWTNNMMFREKSDGKPEEIRLIDYQISSMSTPVQDLFYFMTNSLEEDVRVEEFDTIVAHYQESLEKNLKLLKYAGHIPSLKEIHAEMLKRNMIAPSVVVEGLPTLLMDKGESLDLEMLTTNNEAAEKYRERIFSNPRFVSAAKKYLNFLYKRGMLDAN